MNISKWALNNRKLVILFLVILSIGGIFAYFRMPKYEDPEIIVRRALVVGIYPGASAHQVELELAVPLEKAIQQTSDINAIETYCYSDMCYLLITLETTVPQDKLQEHWQMIRNRVDATALPSGASYIFKDDFGDVFGLFYSISAPGMDASELQPYVDMIDSEIHNVRYIKNVAQFGNRQKCIDISLSQDRMNDLGISPAQVVAILNGQNAMVYSGYFISGERRIRVNVNDRYRSVEDIKGLILQGADDRQIRLGDIANVEMGYEKTVRDQMFRNEQQAIGLLISAQSGSDITKVGKEVEKKLSQLKAERLPADIRIEKVFNQTDRVNTAIDTFLLNLLSSIVLVVLVLMLCMNFRSGLILGVTLLITVLGSLMILYYFDGTIQRVSLASFIFAMGMLVDNAIVIIDGIEVDKLAGKPKELALTDICRKTSWPLLAATLVVILSFLPIFLSPDVTGLYVRDMFIVLAVSLMLSWILALTLVPMMASKFMFGTESEGSAGGLASRIRQINDRIRAWFERLLEKVLTHKAMTMAILIGLLGLSALLLPQIQQALFPDLMYDQAYMQYSLPVGTTEDKVKADLEEIRAELYKKDYIRDITTSIGSGPGRYCLVRRIPLPALNYGELIIDFKSAKDMARHIGELQDEFSQKYPDANLSFQKYNLMFMDYPVQLFISGPDPAVLHNLHDSLQARIVKADCMKSIHSEWADPVPVLIADYDQPTARRLGISRTEAGFSLMAYTEGIPVGTFAEGTRQHDIYLHLTDEQGNELQNMSQATVFGLLPNTNRLLTVDAVQNLLASRSIGTINSASAQIEALGNGLSVGWEEPVVTRYNGLRCVDISGLPIDGYSAEKARKSAARAIAGYEIPEGYTLSWGGEKMATDMSMENLWKNYPLAVLLMFGILLLLFRSYRTSLLLFLCIPFVFIGVIPAVVLSGETFGFVSIVGILGLVGMMVKNGIVLVDEIRLQRLQTQDLAKALIDASLSRLLPVTMTSLTTILGMIPLLFDPMFRCMAAAIIGGLAIGTIVILVIIPLLYSLMYRNK